MMSDTMQDPWIEVFGHSDPVSSAVASSLRHQLGNAEGDVFKDDSDFKVYNTYRGESLFFEPFIGRPLIYEKE
jgi:hypothetical protein